MSGKKSQIMNEFGRIEEDATYSAKGHYNASARWKAWNYILGVPAAVASALAGVSALSSFDNHSTIAALLSVFVAVLTSLMTFVSPADHAAKHVGAANRYHSLRNRSRLVSTLDRDLSISDLRDRLTELAGVRDELNESSPVIPQHAFKKARAGIEAGESTYAVDKKVDAE